MIELDLDIEQVLTEKEKLGVKKALSYLNTGKPLLYQRPADQPSNSAYLIDPSTGNSLPMGALTVRDSFGRSPERIDSAKDPYVSNKGDDDTIITDGDVVYSKVNFRTDGVRSVFKVSNYTFIIKDTGSAQDIVTKTPQMTYAIQEGLKKI